MLKNKYSTDGDFDYWIALSEKNPEAFEASREACIEALILSAPAQQQKRLRGLQWQIDVVRQRAKNPMAACAEISTVMWDQVLGKGGLLESLRKTSSDSVVGEEQHQEQCDATILPFVSSSSQHI
jgi:hypothetical protein